MQTPMSVDSICLQKGMAYLPKIGEVDNIALASTVQSLMMGYGFMLNSQAFTSLRYSSQERILEFHQNVMSYLKVATGGKHKYVPLYGDFPLSVMSTEDAVTMLDSINYYSENGSFENFESTMDKPVAFETIKYTVIKYGTEANVDAIFTDLVSVNTSILPQDMEIIKFYVKENLKLVMPAVIPFKENLCTLAALGLDVPITTPTDVLRIAVYLSGGDISLPAVPNKMVKLSSWSSTKVANPEREKFRFKSFTRAERRYILSLLEQTKCDPRDMVTKDERWKRLGERLHPGEYAKKYPKAAAAFHAIRNDKVVSWYGKLQAAMNSGNLPKILLTVSERPGEFARRLDYLLRTLSPVLTILNQFRAAAGTISNKVLYELYGHFTRRGEDLTNRTIMVKGSRTKTKLPDLKAMDHGTIHEVHNSIVDVLKSKFSKLEPLGKVWIDPELYKIPLPMNMRSIDFSLKPTVRGQRVPIGNVDTKVVRAFYHWTDKDGSLDPDISATFIGGKRSEVLSYSNTSIGKSVHSGDIIARKGNNAEYIDIDIIDAINKGFKYVSIDVRNFRGGGLREMDGMFGLMEREFPQSGTSWRPDTMSNCHATDSTATTTILSVIDLLTMEYIYLGIDSAGTSFAAGDVKNTLEMVKEYTQDPKVSVAHLLDWHATSRGTLVANKEDADKVFMYDDFSHDYVQVGILMGV